MRNSLLALLVFLLLAITAEAKTVHVILLYGMNNSDDSFKYDNELCVTWFGGDGAYVGDYRVKIYGPSCIKDESQYSLEQKIKNIGRNIKKEDAVLVYISCHGNYNTHYDSNNIYKSEYYLFKAKPEGDSIDRVALYNSLSSVCKPHLFVFVSDACQSDPNKKIEERTTGSRIYKGSGGNNISYDSLRPSTIYTPYPERCKRNLAKLLDCSGCYDVFAAQRGFSAFSIDGRYSCFTEAWGSVLNRQYDNWDWPKFLKQVSDKAENLSTTEYVGDNNDKSPQTPIYFDNSNYIVCTAVLNPATGHIVEWNRKGCVVTDVFTYDKKCTACRIGVNRGDVIYSIKTGDGTNHQINSLADFHRVFRGLEKRAAGEPRKPNNYLREIVIYKCNKDPNDIRNSYYEVVRKYDVDIDSGSDIKFGATALGLDELLEGN